MKTMITNEIISHHVEKKESVVRVASIQCSSVLADTPRNMRKLEGLIRRASKNGAKIVVLPECCVTGYVSQDFKTNYRLMERPMSKRFEKSIDPTNHAITISGSEVKFFVDLAGELGIYLTIPFIERETDEAMKKRKELEKQEGKEDEDEGEVVAEEGKGKGEAKKKKKKKVAKYFENKTYRFYNTIALASPKGELVGHYRKNYPWMYPEKSWVTAGKDIVTFDSEYGKLGLAVCFDIHEIVNKYDSENLWALLYCVAWVDDSTKYWFRNQLPEHLRNHGVDYHVLLANWSVDEEQRHFEGYGHTTVYDNKQRIIGEAKTNTGSEIIYTEVPY